MSQNSQPIIPPPPPMTSGSSNNPSTSGDGKTTTVALNPPTKKSVVQQLYAIAFILLGPVTVPFSIAAYFFRQAKNISIVIYLELKKAAGLGLNAAELGSLLLKSLGVITFKDGNTKPLMPRMMEVYTKMADTLTDFHALPCTKESGALGHLMLSRLPQFIWEYLLPYPHPFFRGSVTQAIKTDSNGLITSTEVVPSDQYSPFVAGKKK